MDYKFEESRLETPTQEKPDIIVNRPPPLPLLDNSMIGWIQQTMRQTDAHDQGFHLQTQIKVQHELAMSTKHNFTEIPLLWSKHYTNAVRQGLGRQIMEYLGLLA